MGREGWIAERRGEDRRERLLRLAEAGRYQFNRALPSWRRRKRCWSANWETSGRTTF
jgi:hypothetical protein